MDGCFCLAFYFVILSELSAFVILCELSAFVILSEAKNPEKKGMIITLIKLSIFL